MELEERAVRAGAGYTIGNYLIKGLSFLAVPVFTRLMSTADFGTFGTFSALESILYLPAGLALHTSFKNAWARCGEDRGRYELYVSEAARLILLIACGALAVTAILRQPLERLVGLSLPVLLLLVVYSAGAAVLSCRYADATLFYDYRKYLLLSGAYSVGNIVFSLILILTVFRSQRAMGRILGAVIAMTLPAAVSAVEMLSRGRAAQGEGKADRDRGAQADEEGRSRAASRSGMLRWGLRLSIPTIPNGISQIILAEFDRILIARLCSAQEAGIYTMAFHVFTIGSVAAQSLENVWYPWSFEKFKAAETMDQGKTDVAGTNDGQERNAAQWRIQAEKWHEVRAGAEFCILLLAAVYCMLMLLVPEVVRIMGGAAYMEAVPAAIPMLAGGFFASLYVLPSAWEFYREKTAQAAFLTCICAAVNIAADWFVIPRQGYIAAAYVTFGCYVLFFLLHLIYVLLLGGQNLISGRALAAGCVSVLAAGHACVLLKENAAARIVLAAGVGVCAVWTLIRRRGQMKHAGT